MSEYYVGGVGLSTGNFMMKAEYMIVKSAHHKGGCRQVLLSLVATGVKSGAPTGHVFDLYHVMQAMASHKPSFTISGYCGCQPSRPNLHPPIAVVSVVVFAYAWQVLAD